MASRQSRSLRRRPRRLLPVPPRAKWRVMIMRSAWRVMRTFWQLSLKRFAVARRAGGLPTVTQLEEKWRQRLQFRECGSRMSPYDGPWRPQTALNLSLERKVGCIWVENEHANDDGGKICEGETVSRQAPGDMHIAQSGLKLDISSDRKQCSWEFSRFVTSRAELTQLCLAEGSWARTTPCKRLEMVLNENDSKIRRIARTLAGQKENRPKKCQRPLLIFFAKDKYRRPWGTGTDETPNAFHVWWGPVSAQHGRANIPELWVF